MARSLLPSHKIPAVLALVAAAILGGAALGETVGASPVLERRETETMPSGDYRPGEAHGREQAAQPNQYAITTPQGRFEVGELSQRGLYSQARFGGYVMPDMDDVLEMDAAVARDLARWDAETARQSAHFATANYAETDAAEETEEAPPQLEPLPVLTLAD